MPRIWYECVNCMKEGDGNCHPHDQVRLLPNGDWICECCFDDAPPWEYVDPPEGVEDPKPPRWRDLPPVPKYVP
jgi:hypothetical protein